MRTAEGRIPSAVFWYIRFDFDVGWGACFYSCRIGKTDKIRCQVFIAK